jgi:hypothetical protein
MKGSSSFPGDLGGVLDPAAIVQSPAVGKRSETGARAWAERHEAAKHG